MTTLSSHACLSLSTPKPQPAPTAQLRPGSTRRVAAPLTLAAIALAPFARAQSPQRPIADVAAPIPSAVRFAGTYHTVTRTLTRGKAAVANFGVADACYAVNADVAYFYPRIGPTGVPGSTVLEAGIIPGPTNTLVSGGRENNFVTSFEFAYCDFDPTIGTTAFELRFYESVVPCTAQQGIPPTATVLLDQLPANGCWVFNVDLTGGDEFCIRSDGGDGQFDGDLTRDSFGWSATYAGTGTFDAGIIVAGDPQETDAAYVNPNGPPLLGPGGAPNNPPAPPSIEGTGTYYNPLSGCTSAFHSTGIARPVGSGLGNEDTFHLDDPSGVASGCTYFLGYFNLTGSCGLQGGLPGSANLFASLYMELNATDSCPGTAAISTATTCPATNNSTGVPGRCEVVGDAVAANNSVRLTTSDLPPLTFGIFLHGLADLSAAPVSVGQGVLCIGSAGRFQFPSQVVQVNASGTGSISTATGAFSLASLPVAGAPFSVAAASGLTSYFGFWHRDFVPTTAAFNFTRTARVTWL